MLKLMGKKIFTILRSKTVYLNICKARRFIKYILVQYNYYLQKSFPFIEISNKTETVAVKSDLETNLSLIRNRFL